MGDRFARVFSGVIPGANGIISGGIRFLPRVSGDSSEESDDSKGFGYDPEGFEDASTGFGYRSRTRGGDYGATAGTTPGLREL